MNTETKLIELKRTVIDRVPVGYWIVNFETIWGSSCNQGKHDDCLKHGCFDNEPDHIAEVDGYVTKVTKDNYQKLDAAGMTLESNTNNRYDDTHDFRPRLFKSKAEATKYLKYTLNRWQNPKPWESFVNCG